MTPPKVVALLACGIAISGISYWAGLADGRTRTKPKPESSPVECRWMGRLVAGDGSKAVYQDPQIELGLRADGVLVWRLRAPEPASNPPAIPLKSLENTK